MKMSSSCIHSVTSLEYVVGGDLRDRSNVGSGRWIHREDWWIEASWSQRSRRMPVRRTAWLDGRGRDFSTVHERCS